MSDETITSSENFIVKFSGPAFDNHEISAPALAQSLLALDSLTRICATTIYGRNSEVDIKVKGGPQCGSFEIGMLIQFVRDNAPGSAAVLTIFKEVVRLCKWAFGKAVHKIKSCNDGKVLLRNERGDEMEFEEYALRIYRMSKTGFELSRLTQTLDNPGADELSFIGGGGGVESIAKSERKFFKKEEGEILTENEVQLVLEIVGPKLNGSPEGWTFSEGENEREFLARVEDGEFLQAVKDNRITIQNGTSILALVHSIQKKNIRTVTSRSIIEVLEVFPPE